MATTTNYSWTYPTVGSDQDSWGGTLNTTIIAIDTQVKTVSDAIPTSIVASSITNTPNSLGTAKQVLRMNSGANATEFATPSITDMSDTPASLGTANQILKMNSGATALEWATDASGSGGIALTDLSVGSELTASGDGGITYTSGTGVFQYTPPDLSTYLTSTNLMSNLATKMTADTVGSISFLQQTSTAGTIVAGTAYASSGLKYGGGAVDNAGASGGNDAYSTFLANATTNISSSGTWRALTSVLDPGDGRNKYGIFIKIT